MCTGPLPIGEEMEKSFINHSYVCINKADTCISYKELASNVPPPRINPYSLMEEVRTPMTHIMCYWLVKG